MRIMAVDDEILALEDFEDTCRDLGITDEIVKFNNPLDALGYVATNKVDIAFLDIEMPVIKGIELAKRIKAINPNVRVVFATSYGNYALEAFGVDAVDYVMKPYEPEDIKRAYDKALLVKDAVTENRVFVKTFGYFDIFVNRKPVYFSSAKAKEFMALLVDRQGSSVSTEQAISVLWPDRDYDESVQSLFRKVLRSLRNSLSDAGILDILIDGRNQRSIDITKFKCDAYDYEEWDAVAVNSFHGEYMVNYSWAEFTAGRYTSMELERMR